MYVIYICITMAYKWFMPFIGYIPAQRDLLITTFSFLTSNNPNNELPNPSGRFTKVFTLRNSLKLAIYKTRTFHWCRLDRLWKRLWSPFEWAIATNCSTPNWISNEHVRRLREHPGDHEGHRLHPRDAAIRGERRAPLVDQWHTTTEPI